MQDARDTFLEFRTAIKALASMAAPEQIHALTYHLLCALYRVKDIRERCETLERELDRFRSERVAGAWTYENHTNRLRQLAMDRSRALTAAHADVASLKAQCQSLEAARRLLLDRASVDELMPDTLRSPIPLAEGGR